MPKLKKFCDALSASTHSRIVLANLAHDVIEHHRVDPDAVAAVLTAVAQEWDAAKPGEFAPTEADARAALRLLGAHLDSGSGVSFCAGDPTTAAGPLSRIYEETAVFTYLIHSSAFGRPARRSGSGSIVAAPILIEADHVQHDAMITGRRPVAWATTSETIESLIGTETDDNLATRVRDRLGLDTFDDPHQDLVEILYPEIPPGMHAPTFIEGSCRRVYRSVNASGGWGRAVDLSTTGEGAPESVHPPIPFREGFQLRFLGPVRESRFTYTDEDLHDRCSRKWNVDADVERLRSCCFIGPE